ncbi:MAG TPA: hypothetical protein VK437_02080 [Steroidobacteraceae bacterium]|nr:hypothetical protein [Steroidobacteraceae bacterium]
MRRILRGLKILALVVLAVAVFGYAVMSLWNWVIPQVTGWHSIGFGQAVALLVLCRILFGGFRGRGGWHWRRRMEERLAQMSPEERERFREALSRRCEWRDGKGNVPNETRP